ncbi:DNA helicase [Microbacterium sp. 10M-3C3]|uniref:DNA helicase n=1 Tax=Microbacterium sp. 10M-3C3 TaxID=2483401 RepID=UPI000F62E9BD|nr:DNA helicase [Microbacterium sp. 10M-3C3]
MSLSRKSKKELRKLRKHAAKVWESQQVLLGEGADVAREAGRAVGNYSREQVVPAVKDSYDRYAAPYVDKSVKYSRHVLSDKVVPTAGALVGGAMSVWDAANDTRARLAKGRGFELDTKKYAKKADKYGKQATKKLAKKLEPQRSGIGAGGVIAILLGIAAAAGVVYAAWQTLRADDELWVADDPLRAPDA